MFCSNCGYKLEDGVKFCPNCGTSQTKTENKQPVTEIPIATQQKTDTDEQFQSSVKIGFVQAMKLYFENLFNFKGRATRSEFWWSFLFNIVVVGIALLLCKVFSCDDWDYFILVPIILASSVSVRRLHDAGFFGFTVIVMLVCLIVVSGFDICGVENTVQDFFGYSFIGSALVLFILACKKSSQKENKWGENIRMQSEGQNAVPVMSKKAWRNVGLSLVATVVVFVVCIIEQNNSYTPVVTSAGITQSESSHSADSDSVKGWVDPKWKVGKVLKNPDKTQFVKVIKKDSQNMICVRWNSKDYIDKHNNKRAGNSDRDILSCYIFTPMKNYRITLTLPIEGKIRQQSDIDKIADEFCKVVDLNKNQSLDALLQIIEKESETILLKTQFIYIDKGSYIDSNGNYKLKTWTDSDGIVRTGGHYITKYPKCVSKGPGTGYVWPIPESFNNLPCEEIEYMFFL